MASRSENVEKIIKKNYKKKIILIDRFIDSTLAYQHYGMGLNKKFIQITNNFILQKIKIDYTFLNLVSKKNLLKRLKERTKLNRYDKFDIKFYIKVQNGFIKISKTNKNKYLKINSNNDISINKKIIINKVKKILNFK